VYNSYNNIIHLSYIVNINVFTSLSSLSRLAYLYLYSCSLTGESFTYSLLKKLDSFLNYLLKPLLSTYSGTLPAVWGSTMTSLMALQLDNNQLSGTNDTM
jgi:hypothetical protein